MKSRRIIWIVLGVFFAALYLVPLALPSRVKAVFPSYPVLRATILSPANNFAFNPGANFPVTARITNEGPGNASFVGAVISAAGPASVQGNTENIWQMVEGESKIVNFSAHYNGGGRATITVCPRGLGVSSDPDVMVCANAELDGISPYIIGSVNLNGEYPADRLICSSIIIRESSSSDVSPSVSSGPGSTGSQGSSNVVVTNLTVQPLLAAAGQEVTIFGNVTNRSDTAGSYNATLKVNGQVETVKNGTIGPNVAVPLKFTLSRETQGTYEVDLNGQKTFFTITGQGASSEVDGRIVALIGLSIVVVAFAVIVFRRYAANN